MYSRVRRIGRLGGANLVQQGTDHYTMPNQAVTATLQFTEETHTVIIDVEHVVEINYHTDELNLLPSST